MNAQRLVVVGGGYAGVLAAARAARKGRRRVAVTLVSDRPALVERVRLHEVVATGRSVTRPLEGLLRGTGVSLAVARVRDVDAARGRLVTDRGALDFDAAIVATGSRNVSAIPGADAHAHTIEHDEAIALHGALDRTAAGGRVLVIGGGLSGIELASELAEARADLRITLVTRSSLDPRLTDVARAELERVLRAQGVELLTDTEVHAIERGRALTSRGDLAFDHAIVPSGFRAAPLLTEAGLAVDDAGRALVDPMLRALGQDRLFVAGDAARPVEDPGCHPWMGCKTAMPQGARAADNAVAALLGEPLRALDWRETGYCISLGRRTGVVQLADRRGALIPRILRGRTAAFVKEAISRYTIASIHGERTGVLSYRWFRTGHAPSRALTREPAGEPANAVG